MIKFLTALFACSLCAFSSRAIDPLTATASASNLTHAGGNDGTATATPAGGTAPYTYSWNTNPVQTTQTAKGLPAGAYVCTVKDATGATVATAAVLVTDPPAPLTATITITNITGHGVPNGTATVTPSGGTAPYTYLWSGVGAQTTQTANNLAVGTYHCKVTDTKGVTYTTSNVIFVDPLDIDESKIVVHNPSYKKGNDGSIEIPVNGALDTVDYQIAYVDTPNGNKHDTAVARVINKKFWLSKLTAGVYSNITIFCGNSNVAPTKVPGIYNLTINQFSNKKAVQAAGINAAIFYNYSGGAAASNDFPSGFTQYYLSGTIPLNSPDGIDYDPKSFKKSSIWFRNIYGTFAYTDPSAFDLKTLDRGNNRYVNQLDLFTHANIEFNPTFNLLTYILPHTRAPGKAAGDDAHVYVDLNFGFLVTQVSDSVSPTLTNKYNIKSHLIGMSVAVKSTNFLNTALQAQSTLSIFGIHQNSNSVDYQLGPQYANLGDTLNAQNASKNIILTKNSTVFYNISGQLLYNLNGVAKNSASNIYLRGSFISNFASITSHNYSNAFWAIQIGYILSLDKIFYPQSTAAPSTSTSSIKGL